MQHAIDNLLADAGYMRQDSSRPATVMKPTDHVNQSIQGPGWTVTLEERLDRMNSIADSAKTDSDLQMRSPVLGTSSGPQTAPMELDHAQEMYSSAKGDTTLVTATEA